MAEDRIMNARILIVDDDDDLRETYTDLLMFEGFENTFQAENGEEAIEIAKENIIDIVISDLNMPGMNGIETIKKIKDIHPNIASMILTGFGSMDVAIKAFSESNVDDFLSKPVENEDLIDKIKTHLQKREPVVDEEMEGISDMVRREFGGSRNFFGQYLIDNNYITEEELIEGLQEHKRTGKLLGITLVDMGLLTEDDLLKAISEQKGYPVADDKTFSMVTEDVLSLVSRQIAEKHTLIPLLVDNNVLKVAMMNPDDLLVIDTLKMITKMSIEPLISTRERINKAIEDSYSKFESSSRASSALSEIFGDQDVSIEEIANNMEESDDDDPNSTPIINLVNGILQKADIDGTSDIHIEPEEKFTKIRFRKDGALYIPNGYERIPKHIHTKLVARIKVLSKSMKLDVKKAPQDGKIRLKMRGREVDFRVGSLPTIHGEKIVIRLLKSEQLFPIEGIMDDYEPMISMFKKNIQKKQGMVLVTGPTGSGKTNTLASALNYIKDVKTNIITVEDPVEIVNPGITQVEIDNRQGRTFEAVQRQILRQDPDIILVGEMRDYETAHTGCEFALTGHLVFATLHTNSAPETILRFIEMGIKDYLIASVLDLVLAQRLARRVCKMCKKEHHYEKEQLLGIGLTEEEIENGTFYKGEGCPNCRGTGQSGRIALVEMLELTDTIRTAVMKGATALEISAIAQEGGTYHTLKSDALRKFKAGKIDLRETMYYTI